MPGGRLEAQFYFAANLTQDFTDFSGTTTVTITSGTKTISEIITEIDGQLDADWTITASTTDLTGTGKATINSAQTPWTITWTSTTLRDLLGFTANISAVSSAQTGANSAKAIWIPDVPMFYRIGGASSAGSPVTNARQTVSALGHVKGLVGSVANVFDGIAWTGVVSTRALAYIGGVQSTPINNNFETFMRETQYGGVVSYLRPYSAIRLYWNSGASDYTAGTLQIPPSWEPSQLQAGWLGRYNIELPRLWKTPA